MTAQMIGLLAFAAAVAVLVFIAGHWRGRRSCRNEYPDGWDQGQQAERERWEQATGTTWDALAAWNTARPPDPGAEWEAWDHHGEVPSTEVLLTAANERLGKPKVPSVAEVDELVERYPHRSHLRDLGYEWDRIHPGWRQHTGREPIVADLTGPAAWHYPGEDDIPTLTGLIVTPPRRTGPEWLECQLAAQDADAAAKVRQMQAEVASYRRGITGART